MKVQGLGFQGLGFRLQGLGFRVQGLGFRVIVTLFKATACLVWEGCGMGREIKKLGVIL